MKPNIKLSESIVKRLESLNSSCFGKLFGISNKNDLFITVLQKEIETETDFTNSLPTDVQICGTFIVGTDNLLQTATVTPKFVLVTHTTGEDNKLGVYLEENGKYVQTEYQIVTEQEINNSFLYIRIKGAIPLKSEFNTSALKETFQTIQKSLISEAVFSLSKLNVFLLENEVIGIDRDISMTEFCEDSNSFNDEINRKKNKSTVVKPRVLEFKFLRQLSSTRSVDSIKEHAPIGILDKHPLTVIDTFLDLDCLTMIPEQTKAFQLYEILLKSTKEMMKLFEAKIINFAENKKSSNNLLYQVHHYYPEECNHFLTLLYAKDQPEKELKNERESLHQQLLLGLSMPCFRRANTYRFEMKQNCPLINPHQSVKNTDNGGIIAIVKGKYEYYHYCQNKMDDDGWGCAYRSLQTLASWFKLQGYVDKEVPTFKEIQQCLVDIKDKPANFVGSRQWIGSTEVNFVLNTLLGVESKILYVRSGEEMSTKGPELVNHFQSHGSPIMIGGGVLAHTILGVDYNQQTGNIKFLILDPHYTGGEDLHVIQSKGWCGWKNVDFWKKDCYYNMCLPLVPREV